jgi:hypothetical protein
MKYKKVATCKRKGRSVTIHGIPGQRVYSAIKSIDYDKGSLKIADDYNILSVI